jgi:hypothetical protein
VGGIALGAIPFLAQLGNLTFSTSINKGVLRVYIPEATHCQNVSTIDNDFP